MVQIIFTIFLNKSSAVEKGLEDVARVVNVKNVVMEL